MKKSLDYIQIVPLIHDLKKVIKLYYFHRCNDPELIQNIVYYPNYTTTLNIYRHSNLTWNAFSRTHRFDPSIEFKILLVSKFDRSREIIMQGAFDKLTIVFHPLGLNHFLDKPLSRFAKDHFSMFNYFGSSFTDLLTDIFSLASIEEKRNLLDSYLINLYRDLNESRIAYAVERILQSDGTAANSGNRGGVKYFEKNITSLIEKTSGLYSY